MSICWDFKGKSRCLDPHPQSHPYHLFAAPSPDSAEPGQERIPRAPGRFHTSQVHLLPAGHPMEAGIAQRACGCGPALMPVRLFSDNSS